MNAWDDTADETPMWIGERIGDPNVGVVPVESPDADAAYVDMHNDDAWLSAHYGRTHLGGTALPVQGLPELTPYYLEVEEIGGANFGGGNAQFDLQTGEFDWAC